MPQQKAIYPQLPNEYGDNQEGGRILIISTCHLGKLALVELVEYHLYLREMLGPKIAPIHHEKLVCRTDHGKLNGYKPTAAKSPTCSHRTRQAGRLPEVNS